MFPFYPILYTTTGYSLVLYARIHIYIYTQESARRCTLEFCSSLFPPSSSSRFNPFLLLPLHLPAALVPFAIVRASTRAQSIPVYTYESVYVCVHATRTTLYPLAGSLHTRDDVTLGAVAWITRWPESSSGPSIANYRPRGFASFRDRFAPFSPGCRPAERSCGPQKHPAVTRPGHGAQTIFVSFRFVSYPSARSTVALMMSRVGTVTTGSSGPTSYQDRVSSTSDSQDTPEQPNNSHLGFHAVCKTRRPGPHAILPPAPLETKHWTTVPYRAVLCFQREREREREGGDEIP